MAEEKRKSMFWVFVAGFAAAVAAFAIVNNAAQQTTTSQFCGSACHEMQSVYRGWKASSHYANKTGSVTNCVDCHLPPQNEYFARSAREVYEGGRNICRHFFGSPYDPNAMRQRVLTTLPDNRCVRCHATLLVKPPTAGSRIAHENPEKLRCVECHKVMHERIDN
ncbi:MAG: NapC/NirT family cytochrome c [Sedimentisphaerales bacterium]|nr:NapC/NirT family cytochrome c [Sedimentisphaerales bacterium]